MRLTWLSMLTLCFTSALPAQTKTIAERLGYPANAKLLILHADDLGFASAGWPSRAASVLV